MLEIRPKTSFYSDEFKDWRMSTYTTSLRNLLVQEVKNLEDILRNGKEHLYKEGLTEGFKNVIAATYYGWIE